MVLREMVKEEWRTQSELFKGRNLAFLPFLIFLLTYLGVEGLQTFSTSPEDDIGLLIIAFGFFTGLAAGSIGFSSSDALENVLGKVNFIIFSSRTLPIKKSKLFVSFLIKDLIFYTGLYLFPIGLAVYLSSPELIAYIGYMFVLFLAGLLLSLIGANLAIKAPSRDSFFNYNNVFAPPVTKKSFLDVSRSSGGLFKILMSMGVLLALYFYVINYVPLASYLLANPLSSFAVILGMMSVTVYNWLNTYDDEESYGYLPIDEQSLLKSKLQAFKAINIFLMTPILLIAYYFYGGDVLLSLGIAYVTAYYTGSITAYVAGLNPNERMIDSWSFSKFMFLINLPVIPLLILTAFDYDISWIFGILVSMLMVGKFIEWRLLN